MMLYSKSGVLQAFESCSADVQGCNQEVKQEASISLMS